MRQNQFDSAALQPHLPDVINPIDESFVPRIAALTGTALGGGAEIAMGCRMQIMAPEAQIGLLTAWSNWVSWIG